MSAAEAALSDVDAAEFLQNANAAADAAAAASDVGADGNGGQLAAAINGLVAGLAGINTRLDAPELQVHGAALSTAGGGSGVGAAGDDDGGTGGGGGGGPAADAAPAGAGRRDAADGNRTGARICRRHRVLPP